MRKDTIKKTGAKIYLFTVLILLYMPLFWIFVYSFTASTTMGSWQGFSFSVYGRLFNGNYTDQIVSALLNTLLIGVVSSLLATVIGTLGAIGIHNMKRRSANVLHTINRIPLTDAEIITALSLSIVFVFLTIGSGYAAVIIAHTAFCIPYVILNVLPKLKQMNENTYEAAIDLGATPSQAMYKVILPQIKPGIISGAIMAFTISIDDFVITDHLKMGFDTLSTFIYAEAGGKKPLPPEIRALSSLIFIVVLALLFVMNKSQKKKVAPTV